jgi:hypothetical protein
LLFVFTKAEAAADSSKQEIESFKAGKGGVLTPVVGVDKSIDELDNFAGLSVEAEKMSKDWKVVFVGCLDGKVAEKLDAEKVDNCLKDMVQNIQQGMVSKYLAFDNEGDLINLA